jgi:hypothetical protein
MNTRVITESKGDQPLTYREGVKASYFSQYTVEHPELAQCFLGPPAFICKRFLDFDPDGIHLHLWQRGEVKQGLRCKDCPE